MQPLRRSLGLASLIVLVATSTPAIAQRGDDSQRLSKNGKTEGTIDGVDIALEFGRPGVKDRTLWGGLVPYDRIWRTGADEATTMERPAPPVDPEGPTRAAPRPGKTPGEARPETKPSRKRARRT